MPYLPGEPLHRNKHYPSRRHAEGHTEMTRWKRVEREQERARLQALLGPPREYADNDAETDCQAANDNVIGERVHAVTIGPLKSAER
jgi:hypothetical protein